MRREHLRRQGVHAHNTGIDEEARSSHYHGNDQQILRHATEDDGGQPGQHKDADGKFSKIDLAADNGESGTAYQAADAGHGNDVTGIGGVEAHAHDDVRHPLDDEVEVGDVQEVGQRQQHG